MGLRLYLRGLGLGIIVTALLMGYTLGNRKEALTDSEIRSRAADLGMVEEDKLLIKPSGDASESEAGAIIVEGEKEVSEEDAQPSAENGEADAAPDTDDPSDTPSDTPDDTEISDEKDVPADIEFKDDSDPDVSDQVGRNGESTHELNVSGSIDNEEETVSSGTKEPEEETSANTEKDKETAAAPASDQKPDDKSTAGSGNTNKTGSEKITVGKVSDSMQVARQLEQAGIIDDAAKFDEYLVSRKIDRYIGSGNFDIPWSASFEEIAKILTGR
ncbi:MAG: MSCRAMM family adhesin SdrC [Lachnospiraceae bacterium]|nr:MSCRAMM family adhesin SdrC [Lachnospiraceae bacterium]